MKNYVNNWVQKPKTAQPSKKNSNASSVLCKEINDTIRSYVQDRQHRQDPEQKNKPQKQHKKLYEGKKFSIQPFTPLVNNFLPKQEAKSMGMSIKNMVGGQKEEQAQLVKVTKKSFDYKYIIGKGGFGKVWKVEHMKTRNQYAMKEMLKSLVMTKKSVQSVMNERLLLSSLNSPFLVNMHYAFQDRDTLYLVLDLMEGGDLRYHLSTKSFSQIQAKFLISCIVLGLEYLHDNNIIHRDIKPENLVLDSRGYIRITDLGIARLKKINNSSDTSGTPGYMSPEVICRQNHSFVSDFFALGVISFQLAAKKRPYTGYSRNQIREQILAKQAQLRRNDLPSDWSLEALDFTNRLLQRRPEQRLGFHGIHEVKNHPWIRDLNWKKLASRQIESPFIPLMKKSDFDQDQQITIENEEQAELIEKNSLLLRKTQFQQLFREYVFNYQHHQAQQSVIAHMKKSRKPSEKSTKEKSGKVTPKIMNTSSKTIKNKKIDHTILHSRENIVHAADYTETISYHAPMDKTRNFFKN